MSEIDLIRLFYGGQGRAPTCEPGIENLRPNTPGDECNIDSEIGDPCPNHYLNVDEEVPDEFVTYNYVSATNVWQRDLYHLPPHSQGCGIIDHINLRWRLYGGSAFPPRHMGVIKTHDTIYEIQGVGPPGYWEYAEFQWSQNPFTAQPWTWEEIDDLQIGVRLLRRSLGASPRCTQIYVEVHYGPGP